MSDDLTQRIIGAAMEVHSTLGPGLLESIYEEALCHEFELQNIPYKRQVALDVKYKNRIIQGQRLDLIAFDEVIVEIKSLAHLPDIATAQVLSYLKAARLNRAPLINFGVMQLKNGIKRISCLFSPYETGGNFVAFNDIYLRHPVGRALRCCFSH